MRAGAGGQCRRRAPPPPPPPPHAPVAVHQRAAARGAALAQQQHDRVPLAGGVLRLNVPRRRAAAPKRVIAVHQPVRKGRGEGEPLAGGPAARRRAAVDDVRHAQRPELRLVQRRLNVAHVQAEGAGGGGGSASAGAGAGSAGRVCVHQVQVRVRVRRGARGHCQPPAVRARRVPRRRGRRAASGRARGASAATGRHGTAGRACASHLAPPLGNQIRGAGRSRVLIRLCQVGPDQFRGVFIFLAGGVFAAPSSLRSP